MPIVLKSGSLNLLEPSGPLQACNGIAFTSHVHLHTLTTVSRLILLRMRNVSTKVVGKIKIHILYSITFFPDNRAIYELMWKIYGTPVQATDDKRIWLHELCMPGNSDHRHILSIACTRQQWSRERVSILPFTYIAFLAINLLFGYRN